MEGWHALKLKEIEELLGELNKSHRLNSEIIKKLRADPRRGAQRLADRAQKELELMADEDKRLSEMKTYEEEARSRGFKRIAGVDEAGRGPLAGPVVAASVILPEDVFIEGINDSKKLSPEQREALFQVIESTSVAIGIEIIDHSIIDEVNILQATHMAMKGAVERLEPLPDFVMVDGTSIPALSVPARSIPKGDSLSISIAAASIIAKVTRDRIMRELDSLYPQYGFARHKGYGTSEHIKAINTYGLSPIHRRSFCKSFKQLSLVNI